MLSYDDHISLCTFWFMHDEGKGVDGGLSLR